MNTIVKLKNIWLAVILVAVYAATLSLAGDTGLSKTWKCLELLDEQTQKDLASCEEFFVGIYQKPKGYEDTSEKAKNRMIKQWIKQVQNRNNDYDTAVQAAAALGTVKARQAVSVLVKTASSKRGSNRIRWVAVRSLGLIAERISIPVLINVLDHTNWNVRTYAKVGLAEITGVYFGDGRRGACIAA